jgi:hypothetical protein
MRMFVHWGCIPDAVRRRDFGSFSRRLLDQTRPRAGDGRSTRYDCVFSVRPLWNLHRIGNRYNFVCRRSGLGSAGFLIAQGWVLVVLLAIAGLLGGVPYLLSDKPPRIDGKLLELQFEWRAPAKFTIPAQPDGNIVRVNLYTDGRQSRYAFIELNSITKDAVHATIPGPVPLLTHSKSRSLLASIGDETRCLPICRAENSAACASQTGRSVVRLDRCNRTCRPESHARFGTLRDPVSRAAD